MKQINLQDYQKYISLFAVLAIMVLAFFLIRPFIIPILTGGVLAYLLYPLYKLLNSKIKKEWLSALLICIIVVLAIIIPLILIMNSLRVQALNVYASTSAYLTQNQNIISEFQQSIRSSFGIEFKVQDIILSIFNFFASTSKEFLTTLPEKVVNFFVMLFMLYYFLKDGETISKRVIHAIPLKKEVRLKLSADAKELTNAVVYGSLLTALIQGIAGGIGFFMFGISSPIFWGFMMAVFALIPFVGTGIIWAPAAIMLIIKGFALDSGLFIGKGIGLFIYGLLVISLIDNIIKPKIIGQRGKLHPAIVLLGIFGGLSLFGLIGIILGPVILAVFIGMTRIYGEAYGL